MKWLINLFRRKKNPVYERMTKVVRFDWTIRVWSESSYFGTAPDREIHHYVSLWDGAASDVFVEKLCKRFPRITAVEVLGHSGCGGLFYPDWK